MNMMQVQMNGISFKGRIAGIAIREGPIADLNVCAISKTMSIPHACFLLPFFCGVESGECGRSLIQVVPSF